MESLFVIPDFQTIMLPLLKSISDGEEHSIRALIEQLAVEFNLTMQERKELLSSGRQSIFDNRVGWARTYMKKAGLLSATRRAHIRITDLGKSVLEQGVPRIDVRFLRQYDSFVEFHQSNRPAQTVVEDSADVPRQTPEEALEEAYQELRETLIDELLRKVVEVPPSFFERLVVNLLVKMGYGGSIKDAGKAVGRSGDEGIDGIIKEDKLGLDVIYVQAKRWALTTSIGRPDIQKFVGALAGQGAKKGIFLTTASFTKEAREYMPRNETKIVLIDGVELAQLMIDNNVGCTTDQLYEIKRIDQDYFGEDIT